MPTKEQYAKLKEQKRCPQCGKQTQFGVYCESCKLKINTGRLDGRTCKTCGKPITYSGTGRHKTYCEEYYYIRNLGTMKSWYKKILPRLYGISSPIQ